MNDILTTSTLIVIGTESCVQCTATVRALKAKGIDHVKIDASDLTPAETEQLRAKLPAGEKPQLPVVITPDQMWAGFRPDLIDALIVPKGGL